MTRYLNIRCIFVCLVFLFVTVQSCEEKLNGQKKKRGWVAYRIKTVCQPNKTGVKTLKLTVSSGKYGVWHIFLNPVFHLNAKIRIAQIVVFAIRICCFLQVSRRAFSEQSLYRFVQILNLLRTAHKIVVSVYEKILRQSFHIIYTDVV